MLFDLLGHKDAPSAKGVAAMSRRQRLRKAFKLGAIVEATRKNRGTVSAAQAMSDEPARFEVTAENADEVIALVEAVQVPDDAAFFPLVEQLVAKEGTSDAPELGAEDWNPPAPTPPTGDEVACPKCAHTFVPEALKGDAG